MNPARLLTIITATAAYTSLWWASFVFPLPRGLPYRLGAALATVALLLAGVRWVAVNWNK